MTTFTAETYQNEYLAEGATEVNAIVTVTATGSGARAVDGPVQAAVIVIVDTSGSMAVPGATSGRPRQATCAAIDCIRDGAEFAVIAGTDVARRVYPIDRPLAVAGADTRAAARRATGRLKAKGGTAIGSWLTLADRLFERATGTIRHAILLTDGQNEHETEDEFRAALEGCEGDFQCDCRGIGTDWEVRELRQIASTLLGSVDMVADAGRSRRRLHRDDGRRDGQGGRRRRAAPLDATGSRGGVRQAGRAGDRGPDVAGHGVGPAQRRLPDRRVG